MNKFLPTTLTLIATMLSGCASMKNVFEIQAYYSIPSIIPAFLFQKCVRSEGVTDAELKKNDIADTFSSTVEWNNGTPTLVSFKVQIDKNNLKNNNLYERCRMIAIQNSDEEIAKYVEKNKTDFPAAIKAKLDDKTVNANGTLFPLQVKQTPTMLGPLAPMRFTENPTPPDSFTYECQDDYLKCEDKKNAGK